MLKKNKGFTLIELLVVIAIIGILSAIVLVNLNSARNKAKDVAIKADLESLRGSAELYYDGDGGGDYDDFCASGDADKAGTAITGAGGTMVCNDSGETWCAQSALVTSGSWCVDHTGYSAAPGTTGCTDTSVDCQ